MLTTAQKFSRQQSTIRTHHQVNDRDIEKPYDLVQTGIFRAYGREITEQSSHSVQTGIFKTSGWEPSEKITSVSVQTVPSETLVRKDQNK